MRKKHSKPILNRIQNSTFRALISIIEPSDIGPLAEAPRGGGDKGGSYGWEWEDSPGPEVLAHFGGGGLSTGCV